MKDIDCPYCGHEQDVCQDDGHASEDGATYEEQCESCEKMFALVPSISFDFSAYKADCMNDGPHDWNVSKHIHHEGKKYRRCNVCQESEYFHDNEKAA